MRKMLAALVVLVMSIGLAGAAGDDPKKGEFFTLRCDNGQTYDIVVNGNGEWTPGHDLNSNAILKPFGFGQFTGTLTDPQGNVVERFTEPGGSKRAARNQRLVTCRFSDSFTEDGFTFTFSGTVLVKITGSRR